MTTAPYCSSKYGRTQWSWLSPVAEATKVSLDGGSTLRMDKVDCVRLVTIDCVLRPELSPGATCKLRVLNGKTGEKYQ